MPERTRLHPYRVAPAIHGPHLAADNEKATARPIEQTQRGDKTFADRSGSRPRINLAGAVEIDMPSLADHDEIGCGSLDPGQLALAQRRAIGNTRWDRSHAKQHGATADGRGHTADAPHLERLIEHGDILLYIGIAQQLERARATGRAEGAMIVATHARAHAEA